MLQGLVQAAGRLLQDFNRSLLRPQETAGPGRRLVLPAIRVYQPLRRVVLTDGVGRTLFEEYATHQAGSRGDEETGWVLLGLRDADEVVVLATLPAGTESDAGVGHVRFNSTGQALASRIVRQTDRRLLMVGVVHTHPGSLRHPSDGDFRGDSEWVGQLRGKEGVFGIGTADCSTGNGTEIARQPRPNVQCLGKLRLSWYTLRDGERSYRPLPVGLTLGPDLARSLHPLWSLIEAHAERLERLCRQQAGVVFEVVSSERGPALALTVPLAEPNAGIRVVVEEKHVRYYLLRNGGPVSADLHEDRVDRAVYLLLAELAAQDD